MIKIHKFLLWNKIRTQVPGLKTTVIIFLLVHKKLHNMADKSAMIFKGTFQYSQLLKVIFLVVYFKKVTFLVQYAGVFY